MVREPNEFYPPGHCDFYEAFYNSGLLDEFIRKKREWCFVSNIDNLGASVDSNILNELISKSTEAPTFVTEVTDKTMAGVEGGTLVEYLENGNGKNGHNGGHSKLMLLEIAQVPKEHVDEFKSVKKFKFFNTNNLCMHLDTIRKLVDRESLELDIIVNSKHLDSGVDVIQLETAAGAAMKYFDLLLIKSDLYSLRDGCLIINPLRAFPTIPLVKLGDEHFSKVREFSARFSSIPDVLELNHLTVSGDVTFGKNASLRGTVIIIANHGDKIDIPSGSILESKIVSGNLRTLDH